MKIFPHHVKDKHGLYRRTIWHKLYWCFRCGDIRYIGLPAGPGFWIGCTKIKWHSGKHNNWL